MGPERIEKMMFLKLNALLIPELDTRFGEIRRTQAEEKVKAAKSQAADSGKSVNDDCSLCANREQDLTYHTILRVHRTGSS